ncbi:hypothetical protein SARC_06385 [Sphaeroforma arctica JP610]|uniref:MARVEL domain-containing protein n=1 Tax=Sphaeroforma arctica JP610 TaxID=667725 RepID=A0A0L0FXA0_9EUKA|nr:hypothetical protein SARC_06385 [Sphaeroforma arctica JP610]KNC81274.1 hypothetical protein SARC_06385 [Sphaeroforma arctica JP610]|eukprot:XP_014155176.1 hypothetical protein SARC_06385 [Sphaeroforma arctica JP610]
MLQIIFPFLAGAIEVYCIVVAFVSIWSSDWYSGEGGSYGISTGCHNDTATNTTNLQTFDVTDFCEFTWSDLANNTEKAIAGMLFAAGALGVVAFLLLLIMVLGRCCFQPKPFAGKLVKYICFFQWLGLAGALIAIAGLWGWGTPPGTDVGSMFYLVSAAALGAFINVIILEWTYKFITRRARNAKKKAGQPSPLERSKPPGYGTPEYRNNNTVLESTTNLDGDERTSSVNMV